MKVFLSTAVLVASAAIASAQSSATFDAQTNSYSCAVPNGTYCAGGNIIIRCINGVGHPGNCNDNLAGEFPRNTLLAECYAMPNVDAQAACSKNCVVYGGSGNINGTFNIPGCTPAFSSTTTVSTLATSTVTATNITSTTSTIVPPPITPVPLVPAGTGFVGTINVLPSGGVVPNTNGTLSSFSSGQTPTATPVGPTKTNPTGAATFTGAAATNVAAAGFAAAGMLVAALL